jgi:hypothetical protein
MLIILIAAVLIVVGAVAVVVLRRPRASDLTSVRKYHSALGTIEHLAERTSPAAGDVVTPPGGGVGGGGRNGGVERGGTPGPVPPVPVRGSGEFPDPQTPIVFDDSEPADRYRSEHPPHSAPIHRADRAQRHALEAMNHRPRRTTAVMVVVILVALIGALAVLGSRHPKPGRATPTSSVSVTSSSTPSTSHGTGHGKKHGHKTTKTTPPTVPSQIVALSSTPLSAVYPAGPGPYAVTVSASGPCWVLATATATGSTLWTGTIEAGGSQVIHATGVITVELGAPSGSLTLNNVPVVFPTPAHTPFVATFQPTTSGSSVPATSSTTTTTAATTPVG